MTMDNVSPSEESPDPDAIKMFVGQIPRSMDEDDLTKMFEEFGQVYQVNVLRDKQTKQSKGCCFVTFYSRKSALEAQNALHNIKIMAGMHHPVQMKPADLENRNERKLFVGMLTKKFTENDVRVMFSPYGMIEECTVLRDSNNVSKGCAFVTFATRQCATNAIKMLNQSQTMEGCSAPLVVKFADTPKEKDQKRQTTLLTPTGLGGSNLNLASLNPQYLMLLQQALGGNGLSSTIPNLSQLSDINLNLQGLATLANLTSSSSLNALTVQNLAALVNAANSDSGLASPTGMAGSTGMLNTANRLASLSPTLTLNSSQHQHHVNSSLLSNHQGSMNGLGGSTNALNVSLSNCSTPGLDALTQAYAGMQQYASFPSSFASMASSLSVAQQAAAAAANSHSTSPVQGLGRQQEGPEGSNLFIYHLPQEFGDNDLAQTFMPFGSVLSAKVFVDKQTKLSKCFGFVSYDSPVAAQAAIQSMNGFQIGMKRLKVQLKKSKDKPY